VAAIKSEWWPRSDWNWWPPSSESALDEQDVANAAMILLLPQLRNTMFRLVDWASRTGAWDAPCWRSAEALLQKLHEIGGDA
jgi:hypothetical protein